MSHPLKVLSVCTSDYSGGAARAAYRIHLAVREFGVDSRMLVKEKGTNDSEVVPLERFIPTNLLYKTIDWVRNKVKNKFQHYQWGKYPRRSPYYMSDLRANSIGGALRKLDYDVLHLHWINSRFLPLEELPKDKPIIWTLHDCWPFCGVCHYFFDCERYMNQCGCCPMLGSSVYDDLSRQVWRKKEKLYRDLNLHVVTPSRWLGDCAQRSSLLGQFPLTVIPNCLDTDLFCPITDGQLSPRWRSFQEKRTKKPIVLYGAMNAVEDKRKGFSNLLAALRILEEQGHSDAFELIVFGTNKHLDEIPTSLPIHYAGIIQDTEDLSSLYNIASVMVVPSLSENLSCAIMESLSCGTPVVAFDIGGNSDMIDHQVNGYLAKEKDNEDLARGILWCLDNGEKRGLPALARQKILDNFTPEIVGRQYISVYKTMLNDK